MTPARRWNRVFRNRLVFTLLCASVACGGGSANPAAPTEKPATAPLVADVGPRAFTASVGTVVQVGNRIAQIGLSFSWSVLTKPEGSTTTLLTPSASVATFYADLPGTYVVALVVSDGTRTSAPTSVTVDAVSDAHRAGSNFGGVYFLTSLLNEVTALRVTTTVPPKPPNSGTVFVWPGLQPGFSDPTFLPIDNGVLQPVLTWGPSCAPGGNRGYTTWWVSGQYVNTFGHEPGFTGCLGGPVMNVEVGDVLVMEMTLNGTVWTQIVTDLNTRRSVSYAIDMRGQKQRIVYLVIEEYGQKLASGTVTFTDLTFSLAARDPGACFAAFVDGGNQFASSPDVSSDGLSCHVARLVLSDDGEVLQSVPGARATPHHPTQ